MLRASQNPSMFPAELRKETAEEQARHALFKKYQVTCWFYDILDYPWERRYRVWRPSLLRDVEGHVLEVGVGTGRNLHYYPPDAHVIGIDSCPGMLRIARKRAQSAACDTTLLHQDATRLQDLPSNSFDWYIATFLYCVLPDALQPLALDEMIRVLKPGGRFKILEIIYSHDPRLLWRQKLFAPFVQKVYGARFDRHTLALLRQNSNADVSDTRFLEADTYLLIEGQKIPSQ